MNEAKPETTPEVGQEVAIARHGSWDTQYTFGNIDKITPSGMIDVITPSGAITRFKDLREKGGISRFHARYLDLDVKSVRATLEERKLKYAASAALNAVKLESPAQNGWSKEAYLSELATLETKVATARAAIEEIGLTNS